MLAYICKNCELFTVLGYVNEYHEHFCTIECYEEYCRKNNYTYNPDNLKLVRNALTKEWL